VSDKSKINTSEITMMVTNPSREKYHEKYEEFLTKQGFKFAVTCEFNIDASCPQKYVYLGHEDKSLTQIEVA
jgi:hypothetical protein